METAADALMRINRHICMHASVHVYKSVKMHTHGHACIYMYIYIYVYIYV